MSIKVTFSSYDGSEKTVSDPRARTLMELGRATGVVGIDAECGGECSCATCHVHVDEAWTVVVGQAGPFEAELLDAQDNVSPRSRLACQIPLSDRLDGLKVSVPKRSD